MGDIIETALLRHFYELLDHFLHTTKPRPYKTETIQTLLRSVFLCLCGLQEEKANADEANNHPKRRNSEILFLKERVVEDIRYYLQSTDLTIKQISTRIGFPNTSFFGKYVKKNMGATPLSIRTKNGCNQLEP